jgi:hypothetical protein
MFELIDQTTQPPESADPAELTLHDETIQTLFGIGLKIEYCMLLFDESPEQAKHGLDGALVQLTELISELHDRIEHIR